jgi:predicted metal-binding membrane protein
MGALTASSTITRWDKLTLWGGLGAISVLAWGYLACMHAPDTCMAAMANPSIAEVTLTFLMWAIMMAAMMTPTIVPVVLMYVAIVRAEESSARLRVWCFVAGYLASWTVFSVGAALVQELLHSLNMLNEALRGTPGLSAALLIGAGLYQLSPLKNACLSQCRGPMAFFMTNWRDGARGAFAMGLRHGGYCIGCCWLLMGVLFVTGMMDLLWLAGFSALVLLEKASRFGPRIATIAGITFIAWGVWLLAGLPRVL